jgi:long-chain acyl-CoA synthetase
VTFVERMLANLREDPGRVFVQEARDGALWASTGADLAARVRNARAGLRARGLRAGDRCALLGGNSIAWIATDLALLAEGVIAVPLYGRAQPDELAAIVRDATPALILGDDDAGLTALVERLDEAPPRAVLAELAAPAPADPDADDEPPVVRGEDEPVALVYTSGTSGEPKGVPLTRRGLEFMLEASSARLDDLLRGVRGDERIFHYLPFCFAGSWLMLLLCLRRKSLLTLNTDLGRLVEDLAIAPPHTFQNVPVLLERMRSGVERALDRRGGAVGWIWGGARASLRALAADEPIPFGDTVRLTLARLLLFPKIRKRLGPRLRALICGSAPLAKETQLFFEMVGIPVLQVYGLTETTAICTMDAPGEARAGRVGRALDGVEMRTSEEGEILVRGPNVFPGYWNRPEATSASFADGWFRTGDLGEVDEAGRWKIVGRLKNLLVPASGHNVAPEPIEERLAAALPGAAQVVLVGTGRPHLAAIVTGEVTEESASRAVEAVNSELPHYRRIRAAIVRREPFTVESGLLTANGKLRREAIAAALEKEIDALYAAEEVPA